MLAYIQWASNLHIDRYGTKTFNGFASNEFIEVKYVDRCVGFMKIGDIFYILDKENQVIID